MGNIADSTIANVFILKANVLITPPLSEGCVDGVMRRHVIHTLLQNGYYVKQMPITIDFLKSADEVFVTNAIKGLQWVGQCGDVRYPYHETEKIYHQFFKL
jgi:branched-chain amino acid aminotransferase